jgi:hypothetical protein
MKTPDQDEPGGVEATRHIDEKFSSSNISRRILPQASDIGARVEALLGFPLPTSRVCALTGA